jgi:hypothetical protein
MPPHSFPGRLDFDEILLPLPLKDRRTSCAKIHPLDLITVRVQVWPWKQERAPHDPPTPPTRRHQWPHLR